MNLSINMRLRANFYKTIYLVVDLLAMVFVCFVVLELKPKALHMLNIHSVIKLDPRSIKIFFYNFSSQSLPPTIYSLKISCILLGSGGTHL